MAATKTPKKQNKSSFIRSQPASMSTADVIAAGKAAGIKFTSSLVYMVRGRTAGWPSPKKASMRKTSSTTASSKRTATPSKKSTTAPKSTTSKAGFVRERGHLSPKEIAEDASAHGLKLDANYVYKVRGYDAGKKKKHGASKKSASRPAAVTKPMATAPTSKPSATNSTHRSSHTTVEDLLRAAAAELGLGRAIEILQGERARVRAVIGG